MGHYTYKVQKNTVSQKWELVETYHERIGHNKTKAVIYDHRSKRFVNHLAKQHQAMGHIVHYN